MTDYEDLLRTRRLLVLSVPVLGIAAAAGLAALSSNDALDTLCGAIAGALTIVVLSLVLLMVWRARNPVVSRPVAGRSGTVQSGTGQSGTGQPGTGQSGTGRSDTGRSDTAGSVTGELAASDRAALDALEPLRAARDDR